MISFMKEYLPNYFSSEWSFSQFKYGDHLTGISQSIFTKEGDVIIITSTGTIIKLKVDYSNGFIEKLFENSYL